MTSESGSLDPPTGTDDSGEMSEPRPISERRLARFRAVLERRQLDLEVVIDNVFDAHNAAAIVRSADGFGVGAVGLLYTDETFPKISPGVSGYAGKWTTFHRYTEAQACIDEVHTRGLQLLATHVDDAATSYLEIDWTRPLAVAFGNEKRGCSPELLAAADGAVAIPMQGMAQSFNVSVAAAIILGEAARQRHVANRTAPAWNDEKEAIFQAWIAREQAK
jgi:tRNA (guanosine-2'-O-)-methyltransferase